jgi:hypothetical protein
MTKHIYTLFFSLFLSISSFSQEVYWDQMGQDILGENVGDRFALSVRSSSDGLTFITSADRFQTPSTFRIGKVYVYTWENSQWVLKGQPLEGEVNWDYLGTSLDISDDGNTIAVGSAFSDKGATNAGTIEIFDFDGTNWIQRGADIYGNTGSHMGATISLSGDGNTVAFGQEIVQALVNSTVHFGTVWVYRWDGTNWIKIGADLKGAHTNEYFGAGDVGERRLSLSPDGNVLAIGAYRNGTEGSGKGRVAVFDWDGTEWLQRGANVYGQSQGDQFGSSVHLTPDGNTFVSGAPDNKLGGGNEGRVRVFTWNGTSWATVGGNGVQGLKYDESFGYCTAISDDGTRFVSGSPGYGGQIGFLNPMYGRVEVNQWNGSQWQRLGDSITYEGIEENKGERFGLSTDFSGSGKIFVATGPNYKNSDGVEIGRIQVFRLCGENPPVADVATLPDIVEECEVTSLTAPTATDDCDHSIEGTHNATLPITTVGTTTVTWTYTDLAGNVTTQTQDVIISPCPVGIVENEKNNIKLFPNPTFGLLTISTTETVDIELITLSGQILLTQSGISGNHQLDLTSYAQGMYLLKVYNANSNKIYRVVKE